MVQSLDTVNASSLAIVQCNGQSGCGRAEMGADARRGAGCQSNAALAFDGEVGPDAKCGFGVLVVGVIGEDAPKPFSR